jgi:hypothetical protein
MTDPRFDKTELPIKRNRFPGNRGEPIRLIIVGAVASGLVILAVLYAMTSDRLKPTPKSSTETSEKGQAPAATGSKK